MTHIPIASLLPGLFWPDHLFSILGLFSNPVPVNSRNNQSYQLGSQNFHRKIQRRKLLHQIAAMFPMGLFRRQEFRVAASWITPTQVEGPVTSIIPFEISHALCSAKQIKDRTNHRVSLSHVYVWADHQEECHEKVYRSENPSLPYPSFDRGYIRQDW